MMRIRGKIMMFREMRRIDRKISDDQAKDLLKNNTYGVMSKTIGADALCLRSAIKLCLFQWCNIFSLCC